MVIKLQNHRDQRLIAMLRFVRREDSIQARLVAVAPVVVGVSALRLMFRDTAADSR
jgi:hypothetical protein